MNSCILRCHLHLPTNKKHNTTTTKPSSINTNKPLILKSRTLPTITTTTKPKDQKSCNGYSRYVVLGAVSIGFAMLVAGMEDQKALAFGPEGPLMEDFWDNMRRYGLYALTVSTGALYTIFQPIVELLKNPISAILVLIILVGSFYIVTQVVSAMIGVSDFAYEYGY